MSRRSSVWRGLDVVYIKRRCGKCGTPRTVRGPYCHNCGAGLRRAALWLLFPALLMAGLVFAWPKPDPVPKTDGHVYNPHGRLFDSGKKITGPPPAGSPEAVLDQVERLLANAGGGRGHVFAAVDLLDKLILEYPDYDYACRLKGNLLAQAQRHEAAAAALQAYLQNRPDDANARVTRARQLMALEEWAAATAELNAVAAAHPRYALVPKLLAEISRTQGDEVGAARHLQQAGDLEKEFGLQKPAIVYLARLPQ